jgi:hypothetical protein
MQPAAHCRCFEVLSAQVTQAWLLSVLASPAQAVVGLPRFAQQHCQSLAAAGQPSFRDCQANAF